MTIQVQSLATGQVTTIVATIASATTSTPTPDVVSAPHVETVLRYGIHMAPTTIVLTFSQPLDPSRAQNVALYHLFDPRGRAIPIVSAVYDPVAMTVTLRPRARINLHQSYTLTVDGTAPYGLTGVTGLFLDGKGAGQPGSDFTSAITWRNLATPTRQNRLGRGAFKAVNPTPNKAQPPAHPIVTGKNRPFQRTIAFPARGHLADGKMIVMGRRMGMPQR